MPQNNRVWFPRLLCALALAASAHAASPAQLPPFNVEAEFGVDGLRIQNSSSVLSSYQLQQHGVAQVQDLSGIAPNLFLSNSDARGYGDILALRGVTNSLFFGSPGVALYVDDVPGGSVSSYPSTLLNIDSLTVKAGPQGFEYGRNAPGGVIDIRTRPAGGAHRGRLMAEYGSYDLAAYQFSGDGPLGPKASYSAAVLSSSREGYVDNVFLRRPDDDRRSLSGRATVEFKPAPDLQLRFGVLAENFDDDATRLSSLFSPDPYVVQSNVPGEMQIERLNLSAQLRKTFTWGSLVATTAHQEFDLDPSVTDLDLTPMPIAFSRLLQNEEMWSQEIRFESLPGADKARWRAGVFVAETDVDADALREFMPQGPNITVPAGFVQTERTTFEIDQKTLAAFGSVDRPLTQQITLRVGARAEHVKAEIDRTKLASNNLGFPTPQDARLLRQLSDTYLGGSAGLLVSANESLALQARTSVAYKPAGFSGFTANPALARFEDERQWANEIGVTFGPPKARFGGSLLGFWNRIRDYQFERTVLGSTDFVVVNAPRVTSRGLEAKFMFSPVNRVWWDFHAGITDAKFDDHRDAAGTRVDGRHVPYVPRSTLRTGLTVDLGRGLTANASYTATGSTYYDERNTAQFAQGTHGVTNAQLTYRYQQVSIGVYGQNLLDEEYYQFINPEIAAGSPVAPRRFGVQVAFEY